MAAECPIDGLPPQLLTEILSRLNLKEQMLVRPVSQRWRDTVDAGLACRHELHLCRNYSCIRFCRNIGCSGVCLKTGIKLLGSMPALLRLEVDDRCSPTVLSFSDTFRLTLDSTSAEWLCSTCPQLQEVSLKCTLDEGCVMTLLRRLPGLRALALPTFRSDGEFLSMLPTGLRSLSLRDEMVFVGRGPAFARQFKPCPQLQELQLHKMFKDELPTVLSACPRLERLSFWCYVLPSNLTSALAGCTQMTELHIMSDLTSELNLWSVLFVCRRLKRLRVKFCTLSVFPLFPASDSPGLRHQFDLAHLELCALEANDVTFCRLVDMLPGLRHLEVDNCGLTEGGIASGLRRLPSLQVLELKDTLKPAGPVLTSLSDLPLKSLSCAIDLKPEDAARGVVAVLQRCPALTALRLPRLRLDSSSSLVDELASGPLMEREVALFLPRVVAEELERLPRNVSVFEDDYGPWDRLTGWAQWRKQCDPGYLF